MMYSSDKEEFAFYRNLIRSLNGFLYVLNMDPYRGEWISDNSVVTKVSGSSSEYIIRNGSFVPARLPPEPDFRESVLEAVKSFIDKPEIEWGGVFRFRHKNDQIHWVSYSGKALEFNENGEVTKVACIGIPIKSLFNTPDSFRLLLPNILYELGKKNIDQLTERQQQMLTMIAQGLSRKEMANALNLSIYTIDDHKKALFKKFNCSSMRELVAIAKDIGLYNPQK